MARDCKRQRFGTDPRRIRALLRGAPRPSGMGPSWVGGARRTLGMPYHSGEGPFVAQQSPLPRRALVAPLPELTGVGAFPPLSFPLPLPLPLLFFPLPLPLSLSLLFPFDLPFDEDLSLPLSLPLPLFFPFSDSPLPLPLRPRPLPRPRLGLCH